MKRLNSILWGIVLIAAGVLFALNAFEITDIDIFFDGWWTLFIIIPCSIGMFTEKDKTGNIIGFLIGVFLLLCCQDILGFDMLWKLAVPAIIIIIGIKMISGGLFGGKSAEINKKIKESGGFIRSTTAVFSGPDVNLNGEKFDGAELNAVFGGIKYNLMNAVIEKDCVINATAVFGGIDIFLPPDVNVKTSSTSLFGGISDKRKETASESAVTVYVKGMCLFGGVDIK